jgi:dipeptidyl aminopeptidase/acylaminoacyl peptidase
LLDIASNKIEEIKTTPAVLGGINVNRTGTMYGFVRQTPDTPPDAFVTAVSTFAPVQISHANADMKLPPIGKTEVIRWTSNDGREIEGLLTYPVGYQTGTEGPSNPEYPRRTYRRISANLFGRPRTLSLGDFLGKGLCDPARQSARFIRLRH